MSQSIAALETTCFHCMAILLFFTESPPLCFASWSRDLIILSFSANHITYIFLSPLLLFDSHAPTIPLPLSSHQPIFFQAPLSSPLFCSSLPVLSSPPLPPPSPHAPPSLSSTVLSSWESGQSCQLSAHLTRSADGQLHSGSEEHVTTQTLDVILHF